MSGLSMREPWWLLLPCVVVVFAILLRRKATSRAVDFQPFALLDGAPLPATWRTRLAWMPTGLEWLALVCVAIALAQPSTRVVRAAVKVGVDLALCIDASSSMAATDLDGRRDRLAAAKSAAAAFVAGRPEDRVGLVRFSRYVDVVCPPTRDHAALLRMLDGVALVERDGPEDATGIGAAVARCVQMLRASPQAARAVVLVTDGEENVAASGTPGEVGPLQAAQIANQHGVRVHALAVGNDRNTNAQPSQVEQLAQRTGGAFFRVGDAESLARVWAEIARLEASPVEEPDADVEERFSAFALVALSSWLAAAALRRGGLEAQP